MSPGSNNNRLAVLDLGTNTFHLLIAEFEAPTLSLKKLYAERRFVFMGRHGTSSIPAPAFKTGIETIGHFFRVLEKYDVKQVRVVGTESLRRASNSLQFVREVKNLYGLNIEIIDGLKEAEFIYKGVLFGGLALSEDHMIMDIGGGSNEFIIGDVHRILWSHSLRSGISTLRQQIARRDPPSSSDLAAYYAFLDKTSAAFQEVFTLGYNPSTIVGTAGPFEVIKSLIKGQGIDSDHILVHDFHDLFDIVMDMPHADRLTLKGMLPERADLIVETLVIVKYVIEKIKAEKIVLSEYSIKEGILSDMIKFR